MHDDGLRSHSLTLAVILWAVYIQLFVACTPLPTTNRQPAASNATATADDRLVVSVTNYPLQYFTERIGGDLVRVELLVPDGVDPAVWQPTVEDVVHMQAADLIVLNGATYETWRHAVSLPLSRLVDTSAPFRDRWLQITTGVTHQHGPQGEHLPAKTAAHTWLDPILAMEQAAVIRDRIRRHRPQQAAMIAANFKALAQDLTSIDAQLAALVKGSTVKNQPLLTAHPIYDYVANRYQLNLKSMVWPPGTVPNEPQWAALETMLVRHSTRWMIWATEPQPEHINRLQTLGIQSVVLDEIATRPNTGDFLSAMQTNLKNLKPVFAQ